MSLSLNLNDLGNMTKEDIYTLYLTLNSDKEAFARIVMGHIAKDVPRYHSDIYAALGNEDIRNMCVIVYRGGAKSTLGHTIDTTHDICTMKSPFTIFISETVDQASADLTSVQDELISNDVIKALYGTLVGNIMNKESMEAANGCYVMCRGTGSKIRGLKWKNQRPTKIKLDDTESEGNTLTERQRLAYSNWIFTNVLRAGMPGETRFQFFGTIVHPKAFLADAKNMPMFRGKDGFYLEVPVETNGVPAWPKMYPAAWIEAEKEQYRRHGKLSLFLQEMYHVPYASGKASFNVGMIKEIPGRYEHTSGINYLFHDGKKIPINVYVGVDPADSDKETADATVVTTIGVLPSSSPSTSLKKVVILDTQMARAVPSEVVKLLANVCDKYHPKTMLFETQGGRAAYVDLLRIEMKSRGRYTPIIPFKSNLSKTNKWLNGLEPYINSGRVAYLDSTNGVDQLIAQLESYNSEARDHDDMIDGLFLAMEKAFAPQEYNVDEAIKNNTKMFDKNKTVKPLNWYTI